MPRPHNLEKELSFPFESKTTRATEPVRESVGCPVGSPFTVPTTVYYTAEEDQGLQAQRSKLNTKPYYSQYKRVFSATFYTQRLIDFAAYVKSWLDSRQGPEFFLFSQNVQTGSEAHPAIYSVVIRDSLPDQKLARTLRRPVNPCSTEVKNEYSHNSTPLHTSKKLTDKIFLFILFIILRVYTIVAQCRPRFIS